MFLGRADSEFLVRGSRFRVYEFVGQGLGVMFCWV